MHVTMRPCGNITRVLLVVLCFVQILQQCQCGSVLEIKMDNFYNNKEHDWKGKCCEIFCAGQCDSLFTFCIDSINGNADPDSCIARFQTGEYEDRNNVAFSADMRGVANPITYRFPTWPGAALFKVKIMDDDSGHSGHDLIDKMRQEIRRTPDKSPNVAPWVQLSITGTRPSDKTRLDVYYRIYCEDDYYGTRCSVHCRARNDYWGHYTCNPNNGQKICRPGWEATSQSCTVFSDDCVNNECKNGATCLDSYRNYTCVCPRGYTGKRCETNIDECASHPCQNGGTCVDGILEYTCLCPDGFLGDRCQHDLCTVQNPCLHGGSCYDQGSCICTSAYVGIKCSVHKCDLSTCSNEGTCLDGVCNCTAGFLGATCSLSVCQFIRCLNGGWCEMGDCICPSGYTGILCETKINNCESNPCLNEGSCIDDRMTYNCECLPNFNGTHCEGEVEPLYDRVVGTPPPAPSGASDDVPETEHPADHAPANPAPLWVIGVVIAFAVMIALIIILVALLMRRRKRKDEPTAPSTPLESYDNPVYDTRNEAAPTDNNAHNQDNRWNDGMDVRYQPHGATTGEPEKHPVEFENPYHNLTDATTAARAEGEVNHYDTPQAIGGHAEKPPLPERSYSKKGDGASSSMGDEAGPLPDKIRLDDDV